MPFYSYFLFTLVLELPVILLCFKKHWKFALLIGVLLNAVTWPLLHVVMHYSAIPVYLLETAVVIAEGMGYWIFMQCKWQKAFEISLLANGLSYGAGLLINSNIL